MRASHDAVTTCMPEHLYQEMEEYFVMPPWTFWESESPRPTAAFASACHGFKYNRMVSTDFSVQSHLIGYHSNTSIIIIIGHCGLVGLHAGDFVSAIWITLLTSKQNVVDSRTFRLQWS